MSRVWRGQLSYRDALRILDKDENLAIAAFDKVSGVVLAGLDAGTLGALSLFDIRDELVVLGRALANNIGARVRGIPRLDRTRRLAAAHSVVALTAFFEAVEESGIDLREARLTASEQVALVGGTSPLAEDRELLAALLDAELPIPSPTVPLEAVANNLRSIYLLLAERTTNFLRGLEEYADLLEKDEVLHHSIADCATRRYEELLRLLAAEVPEFGVWVALTDHQATRGRIADLDDRFAALTSGLDGLRAMLSDIAGRAVADRCRGELARLYKAELEKPVIATHRAPSDVSIPKLGRAYLNPAARLISPPHGDMFEAENHRESLMVEDVQGFLAGYLTNPQAARAPLVVLGQPGAGKSMLTRVLAASLPETDFLAIRVELRAVASYAGISDQIEEAIRLAIHRRVGWPELVDQAGGALPVIMLDGFDELLQATGVQQSDYLTKVAQFQERQADLDRPVALIVTSRVSVADRATLPTDAVTLRLEPFNDTRIARWLDMWNATNATLFADRGLHPLDPQVVLALGELAREPLLLMMLALYDAGDNALRREASTLGRAELYERLLTDFARREIRKDRTELTEEDENEAIDNELYQLGVAALAMFNRGQQFISETDLESDLTQLSPDTRPLSDRNERRSLNAAEVLLGRFFFVQESAARTDLGRTERAYEFLHPTFGEFLVSHLIVTEVRKLAAQWEFNATRRIAKPIDAGLLHAATSFALLSSRIPIVEFYDGLFAATAERERFACQRLLLELFADCWFPHPNWQHRSYGPALLTEATRYDYFAANLVTLAVHAGESAVTTHITTDRPNLIRYINPWGYWYERAQTRDSDWRMVSLIEVIRARFVYEQRPDSETEPGGEKWLAILHLEREPRSPVKLSDSFAAVWQVPSPAFLESAPGSTSEDFEVPADSEAGLALRKATLFLNNSRLVDRAWWWRYVSPFASYVEVSTTGNVKLRDELNKLMWTASDIFTPTQRANSWRKLIEAANEDEYRLIQRVIAKDLPFLESTEVDKLHDLMVAREGSKKQRRAEWEALRSRYIQTLISLNRLLHER